MNDNAQTTDEVALMDVLLAPCIDCGHWPGDHHVDTGCSSCGPCKHALPTVEARSLLASTWLVEREAAVRTDDLVRRLAAPADLVRALAEAHSHHQNVGRDVRWDNDKLGFIHWWLCTCGYEVRTDLASALWFEDHVASHQAAALPGYPFVSGGGES